MFKYYVSIAYAYLFVRIHLCSIHMYEFTLAFVCIICSEFKDCFFCSPKDVFFPLFLRFVLIFANFTS